MKKRIDKAEVWHEEWKKRRLYNARQQLWLSHQQRSGCFFLGSQMTHLPGPSQNSGMTKFQEVRMSVCMVTGIAHGVLNHLPSIFSSISPRTVWDGGFAQEKVISNSRDRDSHSGFHVILRGDLNGGELMGLWALSFGATTGTLLETCYHLGP